MQPACEVSGGYWNRTRLEVLPRPDSLARPFVRQASLIPGSSFDVLRSLAVLTGSFDSSLIRLLCANPDLGSLVGGIELDAVVGLDEIIRT